MMKPSPKILFIGLIGLIILLLACLLYFKSDVVFSAHVENSKQIDITPEQIRSIKEIGQWEFLSIQEEELVDTVRKGFFSDDHLVRIYRGTLSIGIDMQELDQHNIFIQADTLRIVLPPVKLLDENFIDEANTRSFHQTGRWSPADREALYQKAKRQMKAHALTAENFNSAQTYGESQVRKLLENMGFSHADVTFEPHQRP